MKTTILGSLAALLAGAGLACAEPCPSADCGCETLGPPKTITLFYRTQLPPIQGPTRYIPGPTIFPKEVASPLWEEAPPAPPIKIVIGRPPLVEYFSRVPPSVALARPAPTLVEVTEVPPLPPITLFRKEVLPPEYGVPKVVPPITLYHKPPPECPIWPECDACAPFVRSAPCCDKR